MQLFSSILLLGFWALSNVTFSIFRHKHAVAQPHSNHFPTQHPGQNSFHHYGNNHHDMGLGTGMMGQENSGPELRASHKKLGYR